MRHPLRCLAWLLLGVVLTVAAGCGFEPLYGDHRARAVSRVELAAVQIDLIREREGQMLRNELLDRFQPSGAAAKARYRLSVALTAQRVGLAIRPDETGSRADLTLNATFVLTDIASNTAIFNGRARSITGYNVLDSEFATTSSEADAVRRAVMDLSEQITTRVSVEIARHGGAAPT